MNCLFVYRIVLSRISGRFIPNTDVACARRWINTSRPTSKESKTFPYEFIRELFTAGFLLLLSGEKRMRTKTRTRRKKNGALFCYGFTVLISKIVHVIELLRMNEVMNRVIQYI